ncbi:MAG TPA: ABC transporter permease [Candidatus Didemnitutus sp.]|jgi:ABC-2 type transport system permease protein
MEIAAPLARHFALTLRLNFRSGQALAYGYLVPIIFLLGFGSVFQSDTPPLAHEMGQLLTITLLGGACFGLPTALVAERERGIWQRYRLLPVGIGSLLVSVLAVRVLLLVSAAGLQLVLAHLLYHTPWPEHPGQLTAAMTMVMIAFLGLGLLVAAIATDVPSVQALGQCLFLPMILIGGVGVPLAVLPVWAQRVAAFLPGRYAVAALQTALDDPRGLGAAAFSLLALGVIGLSAGTVGWKLFQRTTAGASSALTRTGRTAAMVPWIAIGIAATLTGHWRAPQPPAQWELITAAQIDALKFDDLPDDSGIVTPLAPPSSLDPEFAQRLRTWARSRLNEPAQGVRDLLTVAAIADLGQDAREGQIARAVFEELQADFDGPRLRAILAWIALNPNAGQAIIDVSGLGIRRHPPDWAIRERDGLYARKFLGRLLSRIRD